MVVEVRLLARIRASVVVPKRRAMSLRVSPGCTVYWPDAGMGWLAGADEGLEEGILSTWPT
jgi:hypothetical protein